MTSTRRHHRIARLSARAAALSSLCVLGMASLAHAGFAPSVIVVRGSGVSVSVKQDVVASLAGLAEVSDDGPFMSAASDAGLDPVSDEALMQLGTQQYVALILVLERGDFGLHVSYRDGRSGELVHAIDVGPAGKRLTAGQQAQIADGAQMALAGGGAVPGPASPPPTAADPSPAPAGELPPPEEGVTDLPLPPMEEEETGPALAADLSVGPGIGMREISSPSNGGPRTLSTGFFPVADLGLRVSTPPRGHFYFAFSGRYQTSVLLKAHETPSGGVPRTTTLRSHHVQLGVLPGYRFTDSAQSTVIGLFLGWDVRGLAPVDELSIPAYSLHGPCFRPEFMFAFGDSLRLRVAPEVIVVASVSRDLRDLGAISGTGIGLGGEATLSFQVLDSFSASLTFRESHVSAPSEWLVTFTDVERFLTLQGVLHY